MKKLLLFLIVTCTASYCIGQKIVSLQERRNDSLLDKNIHKVLLADFQFFNLENRDFIVLYNIVPESALKNRDSLIREGNYFYKEIVKTLGSSWENENIDVAFIGQQTDRYNLYFTYSRGKFGGEVRYSIKSDTILATDEVKQRLYQLDGNKYVRHIIDRNGSTISFSVITKNAANKDKIGERDALQFLLQYIREQYCLYNWIEIKYLDRYGGEGIIYRVRISDLILYGLK